MQNSECGHYMSRPRSVSAFCILNSALHRTFHRLGHLRRQRQRVTTGAPGNARLASCSHGVDEVGELTLERLFVGDLELASLDHGTTRGCGLRRQAIDLDLL